MSGIVDRIEAATAKLAEQQQRIATSLSALGEAGRHFDGSGLHDAQEALPALETAVHELAADVQAFPDHVGTVIKSEIELVEIAMKDSLDNISARWAMLQAALGNLVESIEGLPKQVIDRLGAFPELIKAHQDRFSAANAELVGVIETAGNSLAETIAQQIDHSGKEVEMMLQQLEDLVREKIGARMERLGDDGRASLQQAFGDMSRLAERGGQELGHAAERAFRALEDELRKAIDQKLPDAQRELVDHAVQALSEEIIHGIAMSTIGAEVSAAMSPYLVYLIAINNALDGVLQLIRLFKNPLEELL
jgi:hypothetical protein